MKMCEASVRKQQLLLQYLVLIEKVGLTCTRIVENKEQGYK